MPGPIPDIPTIVGGLIVGIFIVFLLLSMSALLLNMVKFRAQYLPKDVPSNALVATSYWSLLLRVIKLEGIPGLLRGSVPMWLELVSSFIYLLPAGIFGFLKYPAFGTLFTVLWIPVMILMNRALTSPESLPWFNLSRTLDILLTPDERAKPWLLYFLPGVLPLVLFEGAWMKLLLPRMRNAIRTRVPNRRFRLGIFSISSERLLGIGYWLLYTLVSTPMGVVSIRLTLSGAPAMGSSVGEQVLSLRTGKPPYTGLWDCVTCIIEEEGSGTFFRGLLLSFLYSLQGGKWVMPQTAADELEQKNK